MQKVFLPTERDMLGTQASLVPGLQHSDVMWPSIMGGALAICVTTLMFFFLAAALGFAALSPWARSDGTGKAFVISGALALIVIQWISAAFGGYLTGRLRPQYIAAHVHEIFFRDTMQGFLAWALAMLVCFLLMGTAVTMMHRPTEGEGRMMMGRSSGPQAGLSGYYVDRLFLSGPGLAPSSPSPQDRAVAEMLLNESLFDESKVGDARIFLSRMVTERTGLSEAESMRRVDTVMADEKMAARNAAKYESISSLFIFFAMMIGAFIASVAAGLGGQHRDLHYVGGKLSPDGTEMVPT